MDNGEKIYDCIDILHRFKWPSSSQVDGAVAVDLADFLAFISALCPLYQRVKNGRIAVADPVDGYLFDQPLGLLLEFFGAALPQSDN